MLKIFGVLWTSWIGISFSHTRLGGRVCFFKKKKKKTNFLSFFSLLSRTPIMWLSVHLSVYHKSFRLFSLIFILFLLWLDNFKDLYLSLLIILLDQVCYLSSLLHFLVQALYFFSTRICLILFFLTYFLSLCWISHCIVFLSWLNCLCTFLIAYWAFLEQLFWIIHQVTHGSLFLWHWLLEA